MRTEEHIFHFAFGKEAYSLLAMRLGCRGHCVVCLGKILNSHSAFLSFWALPNLILGVTLRWTSISTRGKQKYSKSLHATEAGDKCRPDRPHGSYADF